MDGLNTPTIEKSPIKYVEDASYEASPRKVDGRTLGRKSVGADKVRSADTDSVSTTSIQNNAVTNAKMADDSIKQAELDIEQVNVTVSAGNSTGNATITSGSIVIGFRTTGNQDQFVDNIAISGTTLTVTLAGNATADNTFQITLLKS